MENTGLYSLQHGENHMVGQKSNPKKVSMSVELYYAILLAKVLLGVVVLALLAKLLSILEPPLCVIHFDANHTPCY